MQPRHRVSRTAIELIKRFEGYRQKAAQLPDGRWTIGHGHTLTARQGAEVSEGDAEALLLYDLIAVAHAVNEGVHAPLSAHQFDALASFAFNIGLDNFARSGVLKRLNEGSPILAACAMELWRKADVAGERIVVDALVRRRAAEKALFLTPDDADWPTAPTHILQPIVDTDAFDLMPRQTPVEVAATLDGETIVVTREGDPAPLPAFPEEEAEDVGPVLAAAEAVTSRLSTIFQEPAEEPEPEHPLAASLSAGLLAEEPFTLKPPEFEAGPELEEPEVEEPEYEGGGEVEGAPGPDLFDRPLTTALVETPPEPEPEVLEAEDAIPVEGPAWPGPALEPDERRVIDDAAPYDFEAEFEPSEPEGPEGGALTLVALAVLGLIFFGGGVFWATNARPMPGSAWLNPGLVGWLAGVAGALFFAVAVYLLLQRLGRAQEREARYRR